jgi:hypothetical protein
MILLCANKASRKDISPILFSYCLKLLWTALFIFHIIAPKIEFSNFLKIVLSIFSGLSLIIEPFISFESDEAQRARQRRRIQMDFKPDFTKVCPVTLRFIANLTAFLIYMKSALGIGINWDSIAILPLYAAIALCFVGFMLVFKLICALCFGICSSCETLKKGRKLDFVEIGSWEKILFGLFFGG